MSNSRELYESLLLKIRVFIRLRPFLVFNQEGGHAHYYPEWGQATFSPRCLISFIAFIFCCVPFLLVLDEGNHLLDSVINAHDS